MRRDASGSESDRAVSEIIQLMLAGEWRAGSSHLEISGRYQVTVATVRKWSAEAARFIRLCRGSEDEIREQILCELRDIGARCKTFRYTKVLKDGSQIEIDRPDFRSWIGAMDLQARVLGVAFSEKKDVASGGGNVEATAEELRQALEEAGYEVRKKDDGKRSSKEAGNDDE